MRETILGTIFSHKMLSAGESVVAGVSGGADSVALLFALLELRDELCLSEIRAIHVNHNLRGEESLRDENFVREMCKELGVPLQVFQADVKNFAAENKIGTEEAARKLRYEFFAQAAEDAKVAVGHNADDNAETVLLNLCRGAGLRGLCGIPPTNGAIVRPLINVLRAEIENYLREKNIAFLTDSTNLANDFSRNRVRNIVMPLLETEINHAAKKSITRTARLLRADEDFLDGAARDAYTACAEKADVTSLDMQKFSELHPAIARRVIRIALEKVRGDTVDITSPHIEAVLKLAQGQSGRSTHLPAVIVTKEYGRLVFSAPVSAPRGFSYALQKNSTQFIPELGKNIKVFCAAFFQKSGRGSGQRPENSCTKSFSCANITNALHFRTRLAGDRISLPTADGKIFTKKLQDYFTDEKIPRSRRDEIPLLAHGGEILWILDEKSRTSAKFAPVLDGENIFVTIAPPI